MSIVQGQAVTLTFSLRIGGQPFALNPATDSATAQLYAPDGVTQLSSAESISSSASGSNWAAGQVAVDLSQSDTANVTAPSALLIITATTASNGTQQWKVPLAVETASSDESALFTRNIDVPILRSLMLAQSNTALPNAAALTDDYLWSMLVSGEQYLSALLPGVPLEPTEFFSVTPPTETQISAINGRPYIVDSGYDLPPDFFSPGVWGNVKMRNMPVTAIASGGAVIEYPSLTLPVFAIPDTWITFDRKTGLVNIVPGPQGYTMPVGIFAMSAMTMGYSVPQMLRIQYTAGLDPTHPLYAAVVALARRIALYGILCDSFPLQSGSISADGLSQSQSIDIGKYADMVEQQAGLLKDRICGINGGILAVL
jgi:hypothetical protein